MSDTNHGWPDKPGVPLNPEKDGWHWLKRISNGWETLAKWDNDWNGNDDFWWDLPGYSDPENVAKNFCYLGPCFTLDEATALQARIAELEAALATARRDGGMKDGEPSSEDIIRADRDAWPNHQAAAEEEKP